MLFFDHFMYLLSCMSETFELFSLTQLIPKILQNTLNWCHFGQYLAFGSLNNSLTPGCVSPCCRPLLLDKLEGMSGTNKVSESPSFVSDIKDTYSVNKL